MNRKILFLTAAIVVIPLFFINTGFGSATAVTQLHGFGHLLFFAAVAIGLSWVLDSARRTFWQQAFIIILIILCLGGTIELAQPYFGRSSKWQDLGINLLGGLFGLSFFVPARRELDRRFLAFTQLFVLATATIVFYRPAVTLWDIWQASRQFPVLSDFETNLEAKRWSSGEIDDSISRNGERSLKVVLGSETYPGTTLRRSFGDWRGYTYFAFSLYKPDDKPLFVTVSIRDHEHNRRGGGIHDRFNRRFEINKGWNDIAIPVADIQNSPSERKLELDRLSQVVIFTTGLKEHRRFYLDYVRLMR
jgi:hypothetical protein